MKLLMKNKLSRMEIIMEYQTSLILLVEECLMKCPHFSLKHFQFVLINKQEILLVILTKNLPLKELKKDKNIKIIIKLLVMKERKKEIKIDRLQLISID